MLELRAMVIEGVGRDIGLALRERIDLRVVRAVDPRDRIRRDAIQVRETRPQPSSEFLRIGGEPARPHVARRGQRCPVDRIERERRIRHERERGHDLRAARARRDDGREVSDGDLAFAGRQLRDRVGRSTAGPEVDGEVGVRECPLLARRVQRDVIGAGRPVEAHAHAVGSRRRDRGQDAGKAE